MLRRYLKRSAKHGIDGNERRLDPARKMLQKQIQNPLRGVVVVRLILILSLFLFL
jgi:hypothetical protein